MVAPAPAARPARGFTIIELMLVVTIVAVLAVFALPEMKYILVSNRIKSVSLELYTSLALARSESIKRNANTVSMIAKTGGWQNGWQVCVDANSNGACDGGELVLLDGEAVDASLTLTGPVGNVVNYNRDGRVTTAALFKITAGTNNTQIHMRCVDVNASGRPSTRLDTNGNDADNCN